MSVSDTTPPRIRIRPGPPPKKLIVKNLKVGTGPAVNELDDKITVHYVGVTYATGDQFYSTWEAGGPSKFLLEETHEGWERGLMEIKAGGRRELIIPSELAYGTGTLVYVIEMVAVG